MSSLDGISKFKFSFFLNLFLIVYIFIALIFGRTGGLALSTAHDTKGTCATTGIVVRTLIVRGVIQLCLVVSNGFDAIHKFLKHGRMGGIRIHLRRTVCAHETEILPTLRLERYVGARAA